MEILDAALEYLDRGWAVIPISPDTKKPLVKWGHYIDQNIMPTEQEAYEWFDRWPNANIALLTGEMTGLVVVDCDNEGAVKEARDLGLTRTPVSVRTKKGWHYYFEFPKGSDWIKNRVGSDGNSKEWPRVDGLDLRGSKGYVLAPPSKNYEWRVAHGNDFDDIPTYAAPKLTAEVSNVIDFNSFRLEGMSLEDIHVDQPIWNRTEELVSRIGKLPDGGGNGRDDRLYKYISSLAGQGETVDELVEGAGRFMDAFFQNHIEESKVRQMCERAWSTESSGSELSAKSKAPEKPPSYKPITTSDLDELQSYVDNMSFFIDPIAPTSGTIIQVFGYSGHGKSMFVRNVLYAASSGQQRFGPFDINEKSRVLYFDFENSRSNVAKFLDRSKRSFGDAGNDFMIWAPFHDQRDMNLMNEAGIKNFEQWIKATKPTHVVIDTIRSAFPGLQENSAEQWGYINQLCLKLRNAGLCVWLLHHSNKPGESGTSGREAGSSNQLTVLETQIKVTQVFWDQETADVKAGIYEGSITASPFVDMNVAAEAEGRRIDVMMQLRYGKVREWSDVHEPVYNIAFTSSTEDDTVSIMSPRTARQRTMTFAQEWTDASGAVRPPLSDIEIASRVGRPVSTIAEWTEKIRATSAPSWAANSQ
jgi:hypothetical protein